MEFVRKKINLRDFTEKLGGNEPCLDNTRFPYDFKRSSFLSFAPAVTELMPFYYDINGDKAIRYGTAANYYTWLRKFIMESKYYIFKNRGEGKMWCEIGSDVNYKPEEGEKFGKLDLFSSSVTACTELTDEVAEEHSCGDIFCLNESAETFYERYGSIYGAVEYIENLFEPNILKWDGSVEICEPFIDFNIFIDQDIDDIGLVNEYVQDESDVLYTDETMVSGYTDSKLKTLYRQKVSQDDDGNELDFVFNQQTQNCELKYEVGVPCNFVYDDELSGVVYDMILEITCDGVEVNEDFYSSISVGHQGNIHFTYAIGSEVLSNYADNADAYWDVDGNSGITGIIYEEDYEYTIKTARFTIGSRTYSKPYIEIDYSSGYKPEDSEDGKQYALFYHEYTHEYKNGVFYRDDSIIGVDDMSFSASEMSIDRGRSASYEAFNVLGEVNSFDDIEKYHDDWFRIKGKND